MIRGRRTKGGSFPFAYREVLAIVLRRIGDHSLSLIEYIWKYVSMIRGRRTKGELSPFIYRGVLAIALRRIGGYSPLLIEYL